MLVLKLKHSDLYRGYSDRIDRAIQYIKDNCMELANLKNGKYEIDGDDIYVIIQDYKTKSEAEAKWEAHKKYIDIQYIIKGREKIGWGMISEFSPVTNYDEEKDVMFLEGKGDFPEIEEGSFAVLTPQYVHKPSISVGQNQEYVKKAVIKVKI